MYDMMHQYGESWQTKCAQTLDCGYPYELLEAEEMLR